MTMKNRNNKISKYLIFFVVAFISTLLSADNIFSQEMMTVEQAAIKKAPGALEKYITNFINEKNFANFNFKSVKEAKTARLGDPYNILTLDLKSLQEYESGMQFNSIAKDTRKAWFPVEVNGQIRTKLEMLEKDGEWIPGEFGGVKTVQEIANSKRKLPTLLASGGISGSYKIAILQIPIMYATFFYIEDSQGEFLVPAMINPQRFKIENGKLYKASEILLRLKDFAVKIDGKKVM